jgi:hypothetical protein
MIAHVVLYEIRPDLDAGDRDRLQQAVLTAFRSIPSVRRWSIGRRLMLGFSYEAAMEPAFGYAAVVEFDGRAGLREYLDHPLHADLSALFWSCSSRTLVFDYELVAGASPAAGPAS